MQDIIINAIFIAIPVIVLIIATILGLKRNIYQGIAKLLMTVLSIIICAILVKLTAPTLISSVINAAGVVDKEILNYFNTTSAFEDVLKFISSLIMPLMFAVVYLVVAFIFSLLYLIPGKLLSNKALERRAALKAVKQITTDTNDIDASTQPAEEIQTTENTTGKRKIDWSKIGLRAGAWMCSVLSTILVLSAFALPINAYSRLMMTTAGGFTEMGALDSDAVEILEVIEEVNSHPTNRCYRAFNVVLADYFDCFSANYGDKVIVSQSISSVISVVHTVSELDASALRSDFFYDLADQISGNAFLCNTATQLVSDLCNTWLKGEAFLGVSAPDLGGQMLNILLNTLAECDNITTALRAVGDALTLQQAMTNIGIPDVAGDTATMIGQIFVSIDSGTANMIKAFVSEKMLAEIVLMPPAMAQNVSEFVNGVVTGVVEIKDDPKLSDMEKNEILNREAAAVATILDMAKDPQNIAAEDLVAAVVDSTLIPDTICEITDNGTVRDPYEVANAVAPEFTEAVANELANRGIDENSELYNSVMALICE